MAVPNIMDPREWLAQHLTDADADLVRSMLQGFVEALMSAEASAVRNAGYLGAESGADECPQRLSGARLGHAGRHDRVGDPEAPSRELLPGVAFGAAPAGGTGNGRGHRAVLRRGRLDAAGR